MTGFRDLPRPPAKPTGTTAATAAPSGESAPGAGAHPLLAHVPADYRDKLAYAAMTDAEKQAEAKRLIAAEDATLARGVQLDLGADGAVP